MTKGINQKAQFVGGRRHRSNKSKMSQKEKTELLARMAVYLNMFMDPNGRIMDESENKREKRNYNSHEQQFTMTTQRKKVGKSTSPNRLNRSTHYIGQPRSTGGNH